MDMVTRESLTRLRDSQQPPCVSIYFPMRKTYPERHEDPVRYSNLVDRAEDLLRQKYSTAHVQPMLGRLRALADESSFWIQGHAGLAILAAPAAFATFGLR